MRRILLCVFLSLASGSLWAGGPFTTDTHWTGTPPRWRGGVVYWKIDAGKMSASIDNAAALADGSGWIKPLMEIWENVQINGADGTPIKTTNVKFVYQGTVGEDITSANFDKYQTLTDTAAYAFIVFDEDGSIFDSMGMDKSKTIGLTVPIADADGQWIHSGLVILNGLMQDGINKPEEDNPRDLSEKMFKSSILHELGHLLNLDHAQVNREREESCWQNDSCGADAELIPTMFPQSRTEMQYSLHRDDKIALSWLYPSAEFSGRFCTAHGALKDAKGQGMPGVDVVARNVKDPYIDARAMVSGVLYPMGTQEDRSTDGQYYLYGLLPGEEYQVIYESLSPGPDNSFVGASGFEPLDHPPQVDGADIPLASGAETFKCETGGETLEMADVSLPFEVKWNSTTEPTIAPVTPGTGVPPPAAAKKTGCSLNPQATLSFGIFPWALLVLSFLRMR